MKILLVGMSANLGGIETFLFNLVKNNKSSSITFDFLYPYKNRMALEDEISELGCKIYKLTPRNQNRRKHIAEIKQVYANDYDIIHCNIMDYSWFEPMALAKKTNSKLIIHSHNAGPILLSLKKVLLNTLGEISCYNLSCERIACGQKAGEFMFRKKDFLVFFNGIDWEQYAYCEINDKQIRKEYSLKGTVIGVIARLEKQKNPFFLLEVFKEYLKWDGRAQLLIVGDGSLKDLLIEKANEYDIEDQVILVGKRNDAYKFYSAFDIFVMPSLFEGLSISLCEAQVNGLKCYTSDNVDPAVDITGNVEFLSLKKSPKGWAEYIFNQNNQRDNNVLEKIPESFDNRYSYKKIYEFYEACV